MPSSPRSLETEEGRDILIQEYINTTLAALIHELTLPPSETRLSLVLKRRASSRACIINPITGALEAITRGDRDRTYSWPGRTAYEGWKFSMSFPSYTRLVFQWPWKHTHSSGIFPAAILQILTILDQAIRTGQQISKR
jgi:meiotic recombination protein SPO11